MLMKKIEACYSLLLIAVKAFIVNAVSMDNCNMVSRTVKEKATYQWGSSFQSYLHYPSMTNSHQMER